MLQPKALILVNPVAGPTRPKGDSWDWLLAMLAEAGFQAELKVTGAAGEARAMAAEAAAAGVDRILVVGGDGTVNEVVQAIAHTQTSLGLIPAGTVNVLANEFGIPADYQAAARIAVDGDCVSIDLGRANDRYFTMMVGIGYDAAVTYAMWPSLKKIAGQLAYVVSGVQNFFTHRASRMRLRIDGTRRIRRLGYFMVVSNTRLYGGPGRTVNELADTRDGLLDLTIFRSRRWYHVIFGLTRVFFGRGKRFARIEAMRVRSVDVKASRRLPYQLDGDNAGHTPVSIEVRPQALRLMVPKDAWK
ncbi:Diacylglycerol kinase [compost metagenome]